MDLSKLSDADLDALEAGDLSRLSDAGLSVLEAQVAPPPAGPDTTSTAESVGRGIMDPFNAGAQLIYHALPGPVQRGLTSLERALPGSQVPEGGYEQQLREDEQDYQRRRGDRAGKFDTARLVGNVVSPANLVAASRATQLGLRGAQLAGLGTGLGGRMAAGAVSGAASGALSAPVQDTEHFWSEKGKQAGLGAGFGAAVPVAGAIGSRIISPRASTNPQVQELVERGVRPTIGQTLGGLPNRVEQKATAIPVVGDMIGRARNRAQEQFNTAVLDDVLEPLRQAGVQTPAVRGAGHGAVDDVHQAVSRAYDQARQQIGHIRVDQQFHQDLAALRRAAVSPTPGTGLDPAMQRRFAQLLQDKVQSRLRNGVMTADTYKQVDSELGSIAREFMGKKLPSQQQYGQAVRQLQELLNQQGYRSNPQAQALKDAADNAFARLVRVEDAAKAAGLQSGQFTPGRLLQAVRKADPSRRGADFARGQAFGQDLARAGQDVLGNTVPDSGTAGRLAWGVAAMGGAGALSPWALGGLLGAAGMYTGPMQNLMRGAVTARPAVAPRLAGALEQAAPYLAAPAGLVGGLQAAE